MKIKINLSTLLFKLLKPLGTFNLNKAIEIPSITIVATAVFHENNKHYSNIFLGECLYKIM